MRARRARFLVGQLLGVIRVPANARSYSPDGMSAAAEVAVGRHLEAPPPEAKGEADAAVRPDAKQAAQHLAASHPVGVDLQPG
jgi:hypothetical protein